MKQEKFERIKQEHDRELTFHPKLIAENETFTRGNRPVI